MEAAVTAAARMTGTTVEEMVGAVKAAARGVGGDGGGDVGGVGGGCVGGGGLMCRRESAGGQAVMRLSDGGGRCA